MKLPCEIVVKKFLPQIRALVAQELRGRYKLPGKEIAALVGTTEAAISQYVHGTRAVNKEFLKDFPEIGQFSKNAAKKLYSMRDDPEMELTAMIGDICQAVRANSNFATVLGDKKKLENCGLCTTCASEENSGE